MVGRITGLVADGLEEQLGFADRGGVTLMNWPIGSKGTGRQIAKDYVAAHDVQFEIGQLRPYLVIYSEKDVLIADLLFETVTGKPNLKMTITDSGQVLRCVVGVSRD